MKLSMQNERPKVGLALSGGVVRGFVHFGVIQSLLEAHVPVDVVGGSSVGAFVGYMFASGMSLKHMFEFSDQFNWYHVARPVVSLEGLVSFAKMEQWLIDLLGDLHFNDLAYPFLVSTTSMETGEQIIHTEGRVAPAVRASCSIPGMVTPTHMHGHTLADGGVAKNTPGEAVRKLGADYVIGIDVFYPNKRWYLGPFGAGIRALEIMIQQSGNGRDEVDCLIVPNLKDATFIDFRQKQELIDCGRRAADAALDEIFTELAHLTAEMKANQMRSQRISSSAD